MTSGPEATVFVVDDDPAVRNSLKWLVESIGLPVACFTTADDFLATYDPETPGCLVLDLRLPGMNGLDLQDRLAQYVPPLPIIMITAHGEIETAVRAMRAGAVDFIRKPFGKKQLLDRIRQALARDSAARRAHARRCILESRVAGLSPRERQVMDLVVAGKPNREIATTLGIAAKTVESHRARVMEKMQADSLAELVRSVLQVEGQSESVGADSHRIP